MRRAFVVPAVFVAMLSQVGCQGSELISPLSRDLDPAGKGKGAGGGDASTSVVLSGGFVSSVRQGVLRVSGGSASFETPFGAPIPIAVSQIPSSGDVFWPDCAWNTDVGAFIPPPAAQDPVGLQAAKDLWDLLLTIHGAERPRHFFSYVDLRANGGPSWNHETLIRWFTWDGQDKYMWEIEGGGEQNLSLIQAVGSWNGQRLRITGGVIRLTRTYCGRDPNPEGCRPARGKGNRPTVVCRNDDTAFPGVEFVTTLQ